MAVYTHLEWEEVAAIAQDYGLGKALAAEPISEGVSNSNYLLRSAREEAGESAGERHILTIYEQRTNLADVPFFLALTEHLGARGLPVPQPLHRIGGELLYPLRETKRAAVVTFLEGEAAGEISESHCAELGRMMAALHAAVEDFPLTRANDLGPDGWRRLSAAIAGKEDRLQQGLGAEIGREIAFLSAHWPENLSRGVIHADLFPDNVFFTGERLSGVIDFYFACHDFFLYDLAIAINAWCFEGGAFAPACARALVGGYLETRPQARGELGALPILLRGAALRFLLTRAYDALNQKEGAIVTVKDPLEYFAKLAHHRARPIEAPAWA